jgi:glutamate 5-kinase
MATMINEVSNSLSFQKFEKADCIVIKIGSSLLVERGSNALKLEWLNSIACDVAMMKSKGKRVVVVSSGSIAFGRELLKLGNLVLSLEESQAAAAVGQIFLAQSYQKCLETFDMIAAQILVTAEDSQNRRRYLNSRATLVKLLDMGVVPIVNENDTVATDEIKFGDNDRLAAQVASLCDADILVLLSDVDGLYTSDPIVNKSASHIPTVMKITEEIEGMAKDKNRNFSKGGMRTKIEAAKVCTAAGCHMVISNGQKLFPLRELINGDLATWFLSSDDPITARKQWILSTKPKGKIFVDLGAEKALFTGKSLLPAGVTKNSGLFLRGDTVVVLSSEGKVLAHGLIGYSSSDVDLIKGCHSSEIEKILGHPGRSVLIHRNDMAIS